MTLYYKLLFGTWSKFAIVSVLYLPQWFRGEELPTRAGDKREEGLITVSRGFPGGGNGNPL